MKTRILGFGLTLGVHTRIDSTVARVRARARVGNVYVNRNMIGAVVGVQPFGGSGLSGTGPKAGGPHYLHRFATDTRLLDPGTLIGGYLYIAVSGLLFVAIGVFASALARNQAVAAVLGFVMLMVLIFGPKLALDVQLLQIEAFRPVRTALDYSQVFQHLDDFSRGIIDTRHLFFYFTGTTLTLILTILGVEAKLLHH